MGGLESELRPSCLQGKHFINWASFLFYFLCKENKFKEFCNLSVNQHKNRGRTQCDSVTSGLPFFDAGTTIKKVSLVHKGLLRAPGIQLSPGLVSVLNGSLRRNNSLKILPVEEKLGSCGCFFPKCDCRARWWLGYFAPSFEKRQVSKTIVGYSVTNAGTGALAGGYLTLPEYFM